MGQCPPPGEVSGAARARRRVAMSWANPTVARLAIGDLTEDACGGVLICSWPMPSHVLAGYQAFAARLKAELPAEAYIYPASTPHSLSKVPPHSSAHPGGAGATGL